MAHATTEKIREYLQRASECRDAAAKVFSPEIRAHYEDLARTWENLAEERKTFSIERQQSDWSRNSNCTSKER
jgi:hypothetical protein